ncbi:hypothetical protein BCR34DRAFT_198960 [Clohesyomyces aquaticus]|uniref:Uncharacterized protein n=1 Tax=Clohesyomyces aquaticus TaxID=1231657 RepID=A0A1Y1ZYE9_9PLEO|nr:hypothetical protein BCR34DRAFT_198960 [Clohesyomyces aquaticus]
MALRSTVLYLGTVGLLQLGWCKRRGELARCGMARNWVVCCQSQECEVLRFDGSLCPPNRSSGSLSLLTSNQNHSQIPETSPRMHVAVPCSAEHTYSIGWMRFQQGRSSSARALRARMQVDLRKSSPFEDVGGEWRGQNDLARL